MYETGFLGSPLCALSWNELSIIVFRIVQGIGGAPIMANSGAVGMVFSFAVAILVASRSISRGLAYAIFVGSTSPHGAQAGYREL
jgi:MFS family permease